MDAQFPPLTEERKNDDAISARRLFSFQRGIASVRLKYQWPNRDVVVSLGKAGSQIRVCPFGRQRAGCSNGQTISSKDSIDEKYVVRRKCPAAWMPVAKDVQRRLNPPHGIEHVGAPQR